MRSRLFCITTFVTIHICGLINTGYALTLSSVRGSWLDPVGGEYINYFYDVPIAYGVKSENQVTWGQTATGDGQSGLGFTGIGQTSALNIDVPFEIGQLRHANMPIYLSGAPSAIKLNVKFSFFGMEDIESNVNFSLKVNETPNNPPPGDDLIYFPSSYSETPFSIDSSTYTLKLIGFGTTANTLVSQFQSPENSINSIKLWGAITRRPELQRPEQTISDSINGTGRKAVVLTHGWNSNIDAWGTAMAAKICADVDVGANIYYGVSGADNLTPYCSTLEWDVFVYDWRSAADTKLSWNAWANAVEHGTNLGKELSKKGYTHVHLLAHSAGAMLIDSAKNYLHTQPDKPFIHLTFFDAYDPFAQIKDGKQLSSYGQGADWADNYVDTRSLLRLFASAMDGTKLLLPAAYNVDVTKWDSRPESNEYYYEYYYPKPVAMLRHAWPYDFYYYSTFTPMAYDLGYQLTRESGKFFPNADRGKKTVCTLPQQIGGSALKCESFSIVPDLKANPDKIHTIGDASVVIEQLIKSAAGGVIYLSDPTGLLYLLLNTGSPVWSKMELNVKEPVNALTFDYEFLSAVGAEGYLTVFVDDNVVGHIDERHVASSGVHASNRMYLGELAPGKHTLAIRVDPYTEVQSSVRLSNMKLVQVKREADFPWTMFLPAITHKVK